MRRRIIRTLLILALVAVQVSLLHAQDEGFSFHEKPEEKKIDVLYDGKLLTAYCYFDSVMKPVLFPVKTVSGITVTRGYPLEPRAGERVDHPHHIGLWMNYESVNGLDNRKSTRLNSSHVKISYAVLSWSGARGRLSCAAVKTRQ